MLRLYTSIKEHEHLFTGYMPSIHQQRGGLERYKYSVIQMSRLLAKLQVITPDELHVLQELNRIRNHMVHEPEIIISEIDLKRSISQLNEVSSDILHSVKTKLIEIEADDGKSQKNGKESEAAER